MTSDKIRTAQELTEYLEFKLGYLRGSQLYDAYFCTGVPRPTVVELAQGFRADGLRIGWFLQTPRGELFQQALEAVTPRFYRDDEALVFAALEEAAQLDEGGRRRAASMVLAGAALLTAALFALSASSNG